MFGHRYFGAHFFGDRYFPQAGTPAAGGSGGIGTVVYLQPRLSIGIGIGI